MLLQPYLNLISSYGIIISLLIYFYYTLRVERNTYYFEIQ